MNFNYICNKTIVAVKPSTCTANTPGSVQDTDTQTDMLTDRLTNMVKMRMLPTIVQVSQQHRHPDRQVNRQVNKHGQDEDVTNNCAGQLAAQTHRQSG